MSNFDNHLTPESHAEPENRPAPLLAITFNNICAIGAAVSILCTPQLKAAQPNLPASDLPNNDPIAQLVSQPANASTQEVISISSKELERLVREVVSHEVQRAQTNGPLAQRIESVSQLLAKDLQLRENASTSPPSSTIPTGAWPVSKALGRAEEKITKTIGWNLNTIFSGVSSTIVAGTGLWLSSLIFFRRYPNEFETRIADLRPRFDSGEEYGMEPLFGRTEIDGLFGKPRAVSNRFINVFFPEKWALVAAQLHSKCWSEFPFLRFRENTIFNSLSGFLKVNASNKPLLKQSTRDAHERLLEEVTQFDGADSGKCLNPLRDGEEVISALTYERWNSRVNRLLITPTKDLCALLANPLRYFEQILEKYEDPATPAAKQKLNKELTGLIRKIEIAVGIFEQNPEILERYLKSPFPKTWSEVLSHAKNLRPLIILDTTDGITYLTRYMVELEKRKQGFTETSCPERATHSKAEKVLAYYAELAQHGRTRPFGEVHPWEERKLEKLWHQPSSSYEKLLYAGRYMQAILSWSTGNQSWDQVKPAPITIKKYCWFGEARMPDPNL